MNERCPICYNMSLVCHQDENERSHGHCLDCGYNTDADAASEATASVELERDTPLGEELDAQGDAFMAQYDDDPNPYAGTYSEE